jgi:hypothetical protein
MLAIAASNLKGDVQFQTCPNGLQELQAPGYIHGK